MRKKITFIEVIIVIVVIVVVVKGYQFWNKPKVVAKVISVPTEVTSIDELTPEEKSVTPSLKSTTSPCPHITPEMVLIKGGNFQMGSSEPPHANNRDELPQHEVSITKDFYIGKYEVTNREYIEFLNDVGNHEETVEFEFLNDTGNYKESQEVPWIDLGDDARKRLQGIEFITVPDDYHAPNTENFKLRNGYENRPVVYISWYGAVAYCNWLSEQEGFTPVYGAEPDKEDPAKWITRDGYRLPTEAEWEYACRAETITKFYWGDKMVGDYCWYGGSNLPGGNSGEEHHEVGQKKPNNYGLYDINGNVKEWCNDWYFRTYYTECNTPLGNIVLNPTGLDSGWGRVLRGGSWYDNTDYCCSSDRNGSTPVAHGPSLGFRLVRNAP